MDMARWFLLALRKIVSSPFIRLILKLSSLTSLSFRKIIEEKCVSLIHFRGIDEYLGVKVYFRCEAKKAAEQ